MINYMYKLKYQTIRFLKCLCIETFDHFFIGECERPLKTEKKAFYHFSISVSVPEIRSFKVTEILKKDAKEN